MAGVNPIRVQRKRTKGWIMPENTVYVGRPTRWGNPITPESYWAAGYSGSLSTALHHCIEGYRAWLVGERHWSHSSPMPAPPDLTPLRGKNLACWCSLDHPCHADVLLEIANQ